MRLLSVPVIAWNLPSVADIRPTDTGLHAGILTILVTSAFSLSLL